MLIYLWFGIFIFSIASFFFMPKYYKWVMSRPNKELLMRVKEMQSSRLSLQKNLEIKKILVNEKIDRKEIEKALTAASFEQGARNFTLAPIMGILGSGFLIVKFLLRSYSSPFMAVIFSTISLLIVLYFFRYYKKAKNNS